MARQSLNLPYLLLSGIIVIAVMLTFIVIVPQYNRIQEQRADIATTEVRLAERQNFLRSVDRKRSELQTQAAAEKDLGVILPNTTSFDDVLRIVNQTATASGVLIREAGNNSTSVQSSARAARARGEEGALPANVKPLGMTLKVNGTYQQLRAFLDQLERAPRLTDVTALSFTRNEEAVEQIEADLQLNFYLYESAL